MHSRRLLLPTLWLALSGSPALARGPEGLPQSNLLIELRWVKSTSTEAAADGHRPAAALVGTGGAVPSKSSVTVSTQDLDPSLGAVQRLVVLNGRVASVSLAEAVPLQWLEYGAQMPASAASAGQVPAIRLQATRPSAAGPRAAASSPGQSLRGGAVVSTQWVDQVRSFVVSAQWPGGREPVRVELRAIVPHAGTAAPARAEVFSTVQVALGEWLTVAYDGASAPRPEASATLGTRAAEPSPARELQLRVSLAR